VIASGVVTTLAGAAEIKGSADGTGEKASFFWPYGITGDGTNLYVTEIFNNTIRKIVIASGVVTTLAGAAGIEGSADGTGAEARFFWPYGITSDGTNLYVVDTSNHTIRKIVITSGEVTTLEVRAGSLGSAPHENEGDVETEMDIEFTFRGHRLLVCKFQPVFHSFFQ
jgi:DNA-binding beta-propeller fold protein YncE